MTTTKLLHSAMPRARQTTLEIKNEGRLLLDAEEDALLNEGYPCEVSSSIKVT